MLPTTDDPIMRQLFNKYLALEPENLYMDGERPVDEAERERTRLQGEIDALCQQLGRSVSAEDVWDWHRRQYRR